MAEAASTVPQALQNPACLATTFAFLDDDKDLVHASLVCKLWRSVLESDDIWRSVYLRSLPEPLEYERVCSYQQGFRRLRGVLSPPSLEPTPLKGSALCYNAATGHLVSYDSKQRVVSIQLPDGSIRSELAAVRGNVTEYRPLLASTGFELVVLAPLDGELQLWDARTGQFVGLLGSHPSYITSLDASGHLVASSCTCEFRLWHLHSQQCLFQIAVGLPIPSPVLEPLVAVCHEQQLVALANCAAPAPSSVVKIYSTQPAGCWTGDGGIRGGSSSSSSSQFNIGNNGSSSASSAVTRATPQATVVANSSSSGISSAGALLLRELPVNAAAHMQLVPRLLMVASCFYGRAVSSNTSYKLERPFTVVVHIWDTDTWQLTRLVSPRLWADYPVFSMTGTPIIHLTQGVLMCATQRSGLTMQLPSCCVHAWQLPPSIAKAGRYGTAGDRELAAPAAASGSSNGLRLLGVTNGTHNSNHSNHAGGSSSSAARPPESYGEGAMALGRAVVAATGGAGPVHVSAANTVMLAVSDVERDHWIPLLQDTGGRVTVMLTMPTRLVVATEGWNILSSRLLPDDAAAVHSPQQHDLQEQEQQQQRDKLQLQQLGAGDNGTGVVAVQQVDQVTAGVSRFIHIGP